MFTQHGRLLQAKADKSAVQTNYILGRAVARL